MLMQGHGTGPLATYPKNLIEIGSVCYFATKQRDASRTLIVPSQAFLWVIGDESCCETL